MNQYFKHENLPELALFCGGIGMLLRSWLLSTENSLGFVPRGHISEILLLILTTIFLVVLFLSSRTLQQGNKFRFNFPASVFAAIGTVLAAIGVSISSISDFVSAEDLLATLAAVLGLLAAAALLYGARCRWIGEHPPILSYAAICLWLMLRLIGLYRTWSSDPQLEDYAFQLLGVVCCMLASYHRATFSADDGHRPEYVFFSLASVYFCCLSLAGPDSIVLYLSLGAWLYSDLCNLTPMPKDYRSEGV